VGLEAPPDRPTTLAGAAQRRLPQSKVGDYMLKPHPSVLPPFIRTAPPLCPPPKTHDDAGPEKMRMKLVTDGYVAGPASRYPPCLTASAAQGIT